MQPRYLNFCLYALVFFVLKNEFIQLPEMFLVSECKRYSLKNEIVASYDGDECSFIQDGRVVVGSYYNRFIKLVSIKNEVLWKAETIPHHDIQTSLDHSKIFFLSYKFRKLNGQMLRSDVLNIFSMEGQPLAQWDFYDHINEIKERDDYFNVYYSLSPVKDDKIYHSTLETSHINSFKEIPENNLYPRLSYLKPGNLVVSMNCHGLVLILNSDLTKLEKVLRIDSGFHCDSHDLQILLTGNILHFNNNTAHPEHGSYLEIIDPENLTLRKNAKSLGFNKIFGSVQQLRDGHFLYTDNQGPGNKNVFEVDPKGNLINTWTMKSTIQNAPNRDIYKVKIFYREFF